MSVTTDAAMTCKPFLKWAGGKKWFRGQFQELMPPDFQGTYYEPFLGGGSFFFDLDVGQGVLSDLNEELIEVYKAIKEDVGAVIKEVRKYRYSKEEYYAVRNKRPRTAHTKAARFIYLNRTCWNGLYRVNSNGEFNVPFGRYKNPLICDAENLRRVSRCLQNVTLQCCDFETSVEECTTGDCVYFDPPYITGHRDNGFHMYNNRLFSWDDQKRLRRVSDNLRKQGVHVLVSNADHPNILRLYSDFYRYRTRRQSLIGGIGSKRGEITEALISSFPVDHWKLEEI